MFTPSFPNLLLQIASQIDFVVYPRPAAIFWPPQRTLQHLKCDCLEKSCPCFAKVGNNPSSQRRRGPILHYQGWTRGCWCGSGQKCACSHSFQTEKRFWKYILITTRLLTEHKTIIKYGDVAVNYTHAEQYLNALQDKKRRTFCKSLCCEQIIFCQVNQDRIELIIFNIKSCCLEPTSFGYMSEVSTNSTKIISHFCNWILLLLYWILY